MIVYHTGDLAADRLRDPALAARAAAYLVRGTARGVPVRRRVGSPRGTGEGHLTQRRLAENVYEYRFTPTTPGAGRPSALPTEGR